MPRPMMTDRLIDRWATAAGATVEPPSGRKEAGWAVNYRIPARQLNWLHAQQIDAANRALQIAAVNFQQIDATVVEDDLVYQPSFGYGWFVGVKNDGVTVVISRSGQWWEEVSTLPFPIKADGPSSLAVTGSAILMAILDPSAGSDLIQVSTDGGLTWSTGAVPPFVPSAAVGAYGADSPLHTRVIIWNTTSNSTAWSDNVTGPGSYTAATTDIGGVGGRDLIDIVHVGGSAFVAAKDNGETWLTLDGGVNWQQRTTLPNGYGTFAIDTSGPRIVAFGWRTSDDQSRIYYSDDLGGTWTACNMSIGTSPAAPVHALRAVGNGVWVASGMFKLIFANEVTPALVSTDDGVTWKVPGVFMPTHSFSGGAAAPWIAVGSDRVLLCRKSVGIGLSSLVMP